jgi:hypothetical protein
MKTEIKRTMKYYRLKEIYPLCREEIYIQSQEKNESGYIIPISAFYAMYLSYNQMEDFYHMHVTPELVFDEKDLEEITKDEFDKALKEGKELNAILMQNSEITELERAKDKIYRSMVSLSNY